MHLCTVYSKEDYGCKFLNNFRKEILSTSIQETTLRSRLLILSVLTIISASFNAKDWCYVLLT